MKRKIQLSESTAEMMSLILDLERLSSDFYSLVRAGIDDDDNPTGADICQKTSELRDVLDSYLIDRINFGMMGSKNTHSDTATF